VIEPRRRRQPATPHQRPAAQRARPHPVPPGSKRAASSGSGGEGAGAAKRRAAGREASPLSVISQAQELLRRGAEQRRDADAGAGGAVTPPQLQLQPQAGRPCALPPSLQPDSAIDLSGPGPLAPQPHAAARPVAAPSSNSYARLKATDAEAQRLLTASAAGAAVAAPGAATAAALAEALLPESDCEYAARQAALGRAPPSLRTVTTGAGEQPQPPGGSGSGAAPRLLPPSLLGPAARGGTGGALAQGLQALRQLGSQALGFGSAALEIGGTVAAIVAGQRAAQFPPYGRAGPGGGGGSLQASGARGALGAAATPADPLGQQRQSALEAQEAIKTVMEGLAISGDEEREPPEVGARALSGSPGSVRQGLACTAAGSA
jgi:hypothetical protein